MRIIYFSILILSVGVISSHITAQCFPTLPAHAQTIPFGVNDSNFNHPGSVHHVCFNGQYYYYGNNPDTIFLEGSARLIIGFSYNLTVFMSNNAQLIIDTTTSGLYYIKKIVYDTTYTMFVDTSYATIDSLIECPGLIFNYVNFPHAISPCYTLGDESLKDYECNIYPTLTDGGINIITSLGDFNVDVSDLSGRNILHASNSNFISIAGHSPGIYLISLYNSEGLVIAKRKIILRRN